MDRALQKEQTRKRVERYRKRVSVTKLEDRSVTIEQAAKLLLICNALDKEVSGLHGKVNLLDHVRFGVYGQTMREIRGIIEPACAKATAGEPSFT